VLGIGAAFTGGADLALAPEAFGLDAAADVGIDTLGDTALDEGLSNSATTLGEDAATSVETPGEDVYLGGHGSYNPANGTVTVPNDTYFVTYTPHDDVLYVSDANDILEGESVAPYRVYGPGEEVPNYTLHPLNGTKLLGNPVTVTQSTQLSDLLQPGMGTVHWIACTVVERVC